MLRRLLGIVALCGLCSGLVVATSHPVPAVAASPPPDSIASYAGGIGSGLATQLAQQPAGLAASGAVLYAADQHFRVVRAIDLTAGSERIFAGGGSSLADGVSATSAAIYPRGLAVDASGNVLIADPPHNKVRMVSTTGIITTVAGTGAAGFSGDGAAASAATLSGPEGVGVDTTGNIFIADTGNHRIRKVDTSGTISTFAGNGVAANSGDGGPATSASLNSPAGVAIDGSANVFIADTNNHEIRKVSGGIITRLAGTGVAGYSGDGGPATSAQLLSPSGVVAVASGDLFIADNGNTRVRKLSGGTTTTFAGGGAAFGDGSPAASSVLLSAVAIAVDASANLYIADSTGGRIRRVDHATAILSTTAGTSGACGYAGDGAQAAAAQICPAAGMTVDSSNNLYFSSTTPFGYWSSASVGRVRKITAAGVISTVAGGGAGCTEPCAATSAVLTTPGGLAADSAGDIFFVDGQLIQKLDTAGTLSVYAGTGAMGYNGDNQLATAASLNSPAGVAVDSSGNVYIADGGNSRVRKVDRGTGMISTVAGTGVPGFSGDGGQATSAQLYARGVAVDGSGNLYIADSGRVRKVSSGVITTYAGQGNPSYAGQPLGDGGRATAAFVDPRAIYVDGSGRLLIADGLNARIRVVSTDGFISTVSGCSGVAPDVSCPPPPVDAPNNWSYSPTLVAVDSSDDAFIGDAQNRILRVQAPVAPGAPAGVAAAAAGDSQVSVRWTAPGADGGNPIYRYTVTPYRGATALNPVQVTGQPVPTSTVVFIANGQTYTFTVTASNVFATSPASPASNPVTPVIAPAGQIVTHAGSVGTGRALSLGQVPYSIAVGPMINGPSNMGSPHVYVGDLANPVVRDLDTWSGIETALVGNDTDGHSGDGGPATGASMAGAGAMVYCADGQTYFADTYNFVIRSVDGSGHVVSTVAGTGQRGNSGDGVPATQATFGRIFGLACRTGGGLYVADSDNGAIRLIDGSGVIHNWWTGFSFPTGIAEVATDQVYVSDAGADNAVWWLANGVATVFAGTPTHAGFSGDGGSATAAMLNDPRGLLFWNGSLFIVDGANNRIRRVDQAGKISTFAGTGVAGFAGDGGPPASAELNHPASIAAGPFQGFYTAFYIADFGNGRVRAINLNPCAPQTCSPVVTTLAGNGTPSLSGDGGQATSAQFGNAVAVATDGAGNQYIADYQNGAIRKVDSSRVITTVAGTGISGFRGDSGPATSALLLLPRAVAVDAAGDIYISDTGNQRVRKVDHASGNISTIAGTGARGYSGDGGPATAAMLNNPDGLAVDAVGNVYVADTGNNRVRVISPAGVISTFAGDGHAGFGGDGGSASSAQLNAPSGLAMDTSGDVVFSDTNNNRVRKVDRATRVITTIAGTGSAGAGGDLGPAAGAQLNLPFGLAFDSSGDLYIADALNQRVRMVDTRGVISTVIGNCGTVAGFSGDGSPASTAQLNAPLGVAVDAMGVLYIADANNNRLRAAPSLVGVRDSACPAPAAAVPPRGAAHAPSIALRAPVMAQVSFGGIGPRVSGARWDASEVKATAAAPSASMEKPAPAAIVGAPTTRASAPKLPATTIVAKHPAKASSLAAQTELPPARYPMVWASLASALALLFALVGRINRRRSNLRD